MTETDFLIKNCTASDFEYACPKLWNELRPSLTAAMRHCDHCNRKVYLCKTDADVKLYTSVNYCIAVAETKTQTEKELEVSPPAGGGTHLEQKVRMVGVMRRVERDRRPELSASENEIDTYDIPDFLRKQSPGTQE